MEDFYALIQEETMGPYTVQLWEELGLAYQPGPPDQLVGQLAAILKDGRPYAVLQDFAVWLREESGRDLTGEGNPDVVFGFYSGGAHCCISTIVYDLGDSPTQVLETPYEDAQCEGYFQDLDDDGAVEFVTCNTSHFFFGKSPSSFDCYNWSGVRVILQYDPGQGYTTASPQFSQFYQEDIAKHTDLAESLVSPSGYDKPECGRWHMCDALMVALDYLYTDRPKEAHSEFDHLYKCPNADEVWNAMIEDITRSPLYAPRDAPKMVVTQASYYMLQLRTYCDQRLPVVALPGKGYRVHPWEEAFGISLEWLDALLRDIDLVTEEEGLGLVPELCTTECSIAVIDRSTDTQVGIIRLDVASGFPGEVYRVDDVESDHWRLRGDFTWERVSQ